MLNTDMQQDRESSLPIEQLCIILFIEKVNWENIGDLFILFSSGNSNIEDSGKQDNKKGSKKYMLRASS